jgi:hypothetical protein
MWDNPARDADPFAPRDPAIIGLRNIGSLSAALYGQHRPLDLKFMDASARLIALSDAGEDGEDLWTELAVLLQLAATLRRARNAHFILVTPPGLDSCLVDLVGDSDEASRGARLARLRDMRIVTTAAAFLRMGDEPPAGVRDRAILLDHIVNDTLWAVESAHEANLRQNPAYPVVLVGYSGNWRFELWRAAGGTASERLCHRTRAAVHRRVMDEWNAAHPTALLTATDEGGSFERLPGGRQPTYYLISFEGTVWPVTQLDTIQGLLDNLRQADAAFRLLHKHAWTKTVHQRGMEAALRRLSLGKAGLGEAGPVIEAELAPMFPPGTDALPRDMTEAIRAAAASERQTRQAATRRGTFLFSRGDDEGSGEKKTDSGASKKPRKQ